MITQTFYPSSYYPEYFKTDIDLGTPREMAFSTSLDLTLHRFLLLRLFHICSLSERETPQAEIHSFLKRLGFWLEGLQEDQVLGLYQDRISLFRLRGTLGGLDLLAKHHFKSFNSFRGLPFDRVRLKGIQLRKVQLSQSDDKSQFITYRLDSTATEEVRNSFIRNAKLFISNSVRIHFSAPMPPRSQSSNLPAFGAKTTGFSQPFKLTQRKLHVPLF